MGLSSRLLRAPRPQKFLFTLPLSSGASLITLSLLLNKLSGLYGILALITGFHLSPFQLSMYIYSLLCLGLVVILSKHIKTSSPFHCLALAWLYVLDSLINALYTAAFAFTWFLVLLGKGSGPGNDTIKETSGFTDPKYNVSSVEIVVTPNSGALVPGQDAVVGAVAAADKSHAGIGNELLDKQSINSIAVIIALWTIRAYFCLVMLSWARNIIRQHIAIVSVRNGQYSNAGSNGLADDPFGEEKTEGHGWKGRLGRFMILLGRRYFLGPDGNEDESWVQSLGRKFSAHKHVAGHDIGPADLIPSNGITLQKISIDTRPTERERRRRSGTGPPLPEVQAAAVQAQQAAKDEEGNGLLQVPGA